MSEIGPSAPILFCFLEGERCVQSLLDRSLRLRLYRPVYCFLRLVREAFCWSGESPECLASIHMCEYMHSHMRTGTKNCYCIDLAARACGGH